MGPDPEDKLQWTSFPLRDDYPRSAALPAIVVAVSVAVAVSFASAGLGILSFGILLLSVGRYFVPTHYTLDERGAAARTVGRTQTRAWSEIRAFYPHRDGVHLSPFERPSPLDPFRGLYLRFARNRDDVLAFVARHVRRD